MDVPSPSGNTIPESPSDYDAGTVRGSTGAIGLAAVVLGVLGFLTLFQGSLALAGVVGVDLVDAVPDIVVSVLWSPTGIDVGLVGIALGALDLAAAYGLPKRRRWAYRGGLVAFAAHTVLAVFSNLVIVAVAFTVGTVLLVQRRAFRHG